MSDLNKLAQHQEELLLAEVAGWLHDYRKCSDEHLQVQSKNQPPNASGLSRNEITNRFPQFTSIRLSLLNEIVNISDLLKWDHTQTRQQFGSLGCYLIRCHHTAHFDKQEPPQGEGRQDHHKVYLSSPFGYESENTKVQPNLTNQLFSSIPWGALINFQTSNQIVYRNSIRRLFLSCAADTRRPINEITLWDWGNAVGALYKSALAGALLGFQPQSKNLRWRLLSVRFDGFAFFAEAQRLPDLLARQELLHKALENVRELIEVEYPMGTEVYRDENGSVFVVPGCENRNCTPDVLALSDGGSTLRQKIFAEVRDVVDGETVPQLLIDSEPWCGQDPDYSDKIKKGLPIDNELPPVATHLAFASNTHKPDWLSQLWSTSEQICTVCGLRPQGPSRKAKDRNVCDTCERRRADRSKKWAQSNLESTIWTNEVADANGRLALVIGQFDLRHWLDGHLIQSLTIAEPSGAPGDVKTKNASFARIRRIWETTRLFWQSWLSPDAIAPASDRLAIIPGDAEQLNLGFYHIYDLVLSRGVKLSVVWDAEKMRFISAENLAYISQAEQLGEDVESWLLRQQGKALKLEEPTGYGSTPKEWGEIIIQHVAVITNSSYTPAIPILAEPRTFMALVPADKALEIVQAISEKYQREMGKVRNRLPLHLGIVFAHRRTPLRAVLDAGRRLLKQKALATDAWQVTEDVTRQSKPLPEDARALAHGTQQFAEWYGVKLQNASLKRSLTWYVPAVMGDGTTKDPWYPYVFLKTNTEPTGRDRYFQAPNPFDKASDGKSKTSWLVHAGDLKKDDNVYFAAATLDFQWLDTAARRFEIAYDDQTGRRLNQLTKPYLLDDLQALNHIWETLANHLNKYQIYAMRDSIETRRQQWQPTETDCRRQGMFWRFCRDVVANAQWQNGQKNSRQEKLPWEAEDKIKADWLGTWAEFAASGWLCDAVELYLQIMKENVEVTTNEGAVS